MKLSRTLQIFVLALALSVPAMAQGTATAGTADRITAGIKSITDGATAKDRGAAIIEELRKLDVKISLEPFMVERQNREKQTVQIRGWNIIAEVPNPSAKRTIMLGAHYDKVQVGKGAVDNASGSIAVIELLRAFKANPLKNTTLKVAFWDWEEIGLVGSREFVKANDGKLPTVYVNFDVYGFGDTIFLGAKNLDADFVKATKTAAEKGGFKIKADTEYPGSDHIAFWEKTEGYSFSLMNAADVELLMPAYKGVKGAVAPDVLKSIHNPGDLPEKINAAEVAKSLPIIEQAIRSLDK